MTVDIPIDVAELLLPMVEYMLDWHGQQGASTTYTPSQVAGLTDLRRQLHDALHRNPRSSE